MNPPALTRLVLLGTIVGLTLYDIAVIRLCGSEASISCVAHAFARQHPIAALAVGVILGHIFWPLLEAR